MDPETPPSPPEDALPVFRPVTFGGGASQSPASQSLASGAESALQTPDSPHAAPLASQWDDEPTATAMPPHRTIPAPSQPASGPAPEASRTPTPADLRLLRRLLLGRDGDDALDRVARGDMPAAPASGAVDARSVGSVLPEAVLVREAQDHDLGDALAGPIERGLKTSVERNPQPIVDAIFPVIGPAIRRAIRHAMAQSLESVNQSVNYGLSWRGLKWRMEARRSGLSFGEVVLRHTLQYRVEQVLLVHRETGLLLSHVIAPGVADAEDDGDQVSAMLTAIRQFVGESFHIDEDDALNTIESGDLSVWIEPGPRAIVAAVIRGHPPEAYRQRLKGACETIHARLGDALTAFSGETAPFDAAETVLNDLLDAEYAEEPASGVSPRLLALLVLLLGALVWLGVRAWDRQQKESAYLKALHAEPGLDVLRTDHEDGRLVVIGARDPLASDPTRFLAPAGLDPDDLDARWVTAYSTDSSLVARRAAEAFGVPSGITLTASPDGTIRASGARGDTAWVARAREVMALVPGARRLDLSGMQDDLGAATAAVEALVFQFGENGARPPEAALTDLRAKVTRLSAAAGERGQRLVLEVTGHTDNTGTPEANTALGLSRARAVAAGIQGMAENLDVRTLSAGATEALASGAHSPSRRVTFRVLPPE